GARANGCRACKHQDFPCRKSRLTLVADPVGRALSELDAGKACEAPWGPENGGTIEKDPDFLPCIPGNPPARWSLGSKSSPGCNPLQKLLNIPHTPLSSLPTVGGDENAVEIDETPGRGSVPQVLQAVPELLVQPAGHAPQIQEPALRHLARRRTACKASLGPTRCTAGELGSSRTAKARVAGKDAGTGQAVAPESPAGTPSPAVEAPSGIREPAALPGGEAGRPPVR